MTTYRSFVKLDDVDLMAFVFKRRPKDYGGVHLAISPAAARDLDLLVEELTREPLGHHRTVPAPLLDDSIPDRIAPGMAFRRLRTVRIGTSIDATTAVSATSISAAVVVSPDDLVHLREAVALVAASGGDFCLAGTSGSWEDRLWFWPR